MLVCYVVKHPQVSCYMLCIIIISCHHHIVVIQSSIHIRFYYHHIQHMSSRSSIINISSATCKVQTTQCTNKSPKNCLLYRKSQIVKLSKLMNSFVWCAYYNVLQLYPKPNCMKFKTDHTPFIQTIFVLIQSDSSLAWLTIISLCNHWVHQHITLLYI